MERESFEDEEVAALLNRHFVAVKVDREERPDIDSVYMNVCQMMTGQGGWPLNVFLTPDRKPFYAGTYFPKESAYGRPGMVDILPQLAEKYREEPDKIGEIAEKVTAALRAGSGEGSRKEVSEKTVKKAYMQIAGQFDEEYGGFGQEPKFPMPHQLLFLLGYFKYSGEDQALEMVEDTLNAMADGGIYDQIGGGFARYSTDRVWLVPHFEKMLYDNALLLYAYAEGYQATGDERFRKIAGEVFRFVQREMTNADGAFYSAIDADSEGIEGKYYVWDYNEVLNVLGHQDGELFCRIYDLSEQGNFEGKNIPNLVWTSIENEAEDLGIPLDELEAKIETMKRELLASREQRVYPHLDDKVLTSWNALMIAGLAKAGAVFGEEEYLAAAKKAARFIEDRMVRDGELFARFRDGEVKYEGYLDDYAYLLWAYLELFSAEQESIYVQKAKDLAGKMIELFWDDENGGFYFTAHHGEELLVREKQVLDSALPSGNSVAAFHLWRLSKLTGDRSLDEKVTEMLGSFGEEISLYPSGPVYMLLAVLGKHAGGGEWVVSGTDTAKRREFAASYHKHHHPFDVLIEIGDEAGLPEEWEDKRSEHPFALFHCKNFACERPELSLEKALEKENSE